MGGLVAVVMAAGAVLPADACPGGGRADKVGGDYVVRPGDTLSGIAAEHGIRGGVSRLYELNRDVLVSPDRIYAGQRLSINPSFKPTEYFILILVGGKIVAKTPVSENVNSLYAVIRGSSGAVEVVTYHFAKPVVADALIDLAGIAVTVKIVTRSGKTTNILPLKPGESTTLGLPVSSSHPRR